MPEVSLVYAHFEIPESMAWEEVSRSLRLRYCDFLVVSLSGVTLYGLVSLWDMSQSLFQELCILG